MSKIFLIEDHNEALGVWRKLGLRGINLVHIDAHIDFGVFTVKPLKKVFQEAKNIKEMKRYLEQSILFKRYEKDFNIQTNIGNYIYPAIEEGIVKDFYWVVPGGLKEFKESGKIIKNIIKIFAKQGLITSGGKGKFTVKGVQEGICSWELLGRKFVICILEKLPVMKEKVLLDIDTDFLVIKSLIVANNTQKIGERKPWISPKELKRSLEKIKTHVVTIAYSVNGGYTPMIYKHLGDEIAYHFSPVIFKEHFYKSSEAGRYFNLFSSTGKNKYYKKAARINSSYRASDNNYGPIYLQIRKLSLAEKEFSRILRADPKNCAAVTGLGRVALERKNFKKAKERFTSVLRNMRNQKPFIKLKEKSLLGLALAEFGLKNFGSAKKPMISYQKIKPLQPQSYYLLGRIYEKERKYFQAANCYKDTIRLGGGNIEIISRLVQLSLCVEENGDIINTVSYNYNEIKKKYLWVKNLSLKKKRVKELNKLENRIAALKEKTKGGK